MGDESDALTDNIESAQDLYMLDEANYTMRCAKCGAVKLITDPETSLLVDVYGVTHHCPNIPLKVFTPDMIQPPKGQEKHSQEVIDIINSPQVSKLLRYKGQAVKMKKLKECKLLAAFKGKHTVLKESEYVCRIGISYNNMKDVIAKRASGELPATPKPMIWGEWVPGLENYIKRHTKDGMVHLYFRLYTVKGALSWNRSRYMIDGKEATKEEAQRLCTKFDEMDSGQDCFDIHIRDLVEVNGENIKA